MDTVQQQQPTVPATAGPSRSRKTYAWILLFALFAGAVIVRVALDDDPKPATKAVTLRGFADAGEPLQNAALSIRTPDGDELVAARPGATKTLGSFIVRAELPPDFRVTVSGGTIGEQVFSGRLVADIVDYGPSSSAIHVTPITTLRAAYADRHGDLSPTQVDAALRRFLKLPAALDPRGDLGRNEQAFSAKEFVAQASAAGGVQPFVTRLVAEMEARPAQTHAFVGAVDNGLIPTPEEAAKKLGEVVLTKLANTGLSHLLETIGVSDPEPEELKLLHEIHEQLLNLQTTVNSISQKLDQASYDQWAIEVYKIKNLVVGNMEDLQIAADNKDGALAKRVSDSIRDNLAKPKAMKNLHDALTGPASTTGAYRAWSTLLKTKTTTFWTPKTSAELFGYFDFYRVIQADLLYLLAEQADMEGILPKSFQDGDLANYNLYQQQQLDLRNTMKPVPLPLDVRSGLMWATDDRGAKPVAWSQPPNPAQFDVVPQKILDGQNGTFCLWRRIREGNTCTNLGPLNGFTDWRLPTEPELKALMAGQTAPRTWLRDQWAAPNAFKDWQGDLTSIWSSTGELTYRGTICRVDGVMKINMYHLAVIDLATGKRAQICDNDQSNVWPVRAVTATEKYWL